MPKSSSQKEKGTKNVFKVFIFSSYLFYFLICFTLFLLFKVFELTSIDHQNNSNESASVKKHGMGKGLMTVWRVVNPEGGDTPTGIDFSNQQIVAPSQTIPVVRRQPPRNKRRQPLVSQMVSYQNFQSQGFMLTSFF